MKIDNSINPLQNSGASQARTGSRAGGNATQGSKSSSQDKVDINPLSSQLQALESSLDNVQVVDTARVDSIKQAISEGRFKVNPDVVADRLLASVKELVLNRKG